MMAKLNPADNRIPPLDELNAEALKHLDDMKGELDEAMLDLDALERLGLDQSRLKERIEWGFKAREVILKRFGEKK